MQMSFSFNHSNIWSPTKLFCHLCNKEEGTEGGLSHHAETHTMEVASGRAGVNLEVPWVGLHPYLPHYPVHGACFGFHFWGILSFDLLLARLVFLFVLVWFGVFLWGGIEDFY